MKNNKGFTLIELAVSFCLAATISIMLLQLVLSLKEVYISGDIKTTMLNKQGIMVKKIYDDLNAKQINSITSCGLSCLNFKYNDGSESNLLVDPGNRTLTYKDYTLQLDSSSKFGKVSFTYEEPDYTSQSISDDSIFNISIPIYSKLLDDDFGIHIVKTYNHNLTTINTNTELANTKVTISGVDTSLAYALDTDDNSKLAGIFVKIFHQTNGTSISDYNTFIKSKNSDTLSSLTSLETFRTTLNLKKVIESQTNMINNDSSLNDSQKKKQIKMMTENFQNGYFSLLLNYGNVQNKIDLNSNYTWWYQASNFAKKESLSGVVLTSDDSYNPYLIPTKYTNACVFEGLQYNADKNSWASGCDENHYAIGLKSGNILAPPSGNVASVELWAEAREYLCNYSLSNVTLNGSRIKDQKWYDGSDLCS